jgi:hypothetical protein
MRIFQMSENDQWPAYKEKELPPSASPSLREALARLGAATQQTRRALNTRYLFLEMKRKRAFADAINNTPIVPGANIVAGALLVDLITREIVQRG